MKLEPALKRFEDSESTGELPEAEVEVGLVFPMGSQLAQMFEPAEGPLNRPAMAEVLLLARRPPRPAAEEGVSWAQSHANRI